MHRSSLAVCLFLALPVLAGEVDLVVIAGEGLAERSYTVHLDERVVLERPSDSAEVSIARATRRLEPGTHTLVVKVSREGAAPLERRFEVSLPGPQGVKITAAGDEVRLEELKEVALTRIAAKDATARGLPPASIELDGAGLMVRSLPGEGCYLQGSGPPGGPLGISVEAYADTPAEEAALGAMAGKRFAGRSFMAGQVATIRLAGRSVRAFTCVTDPSHARSLHLLALFPRAEGARDGVLLDFWCSAGAGDPLSPEAMLRLERHGDTLRSLCLRFEPASIGSATLEKDGTIVLQLRAESEDGAVGDALLRYPKDHPKYEEILRHLGGLRPGETKPVPPFPD